MEILAPISAGELVDKITILRIKVARLEGAKRLNVASELASLEAVAARALPASNTLTAITAALRAVNEQLWEIEDRIRSLEVSKTFDGAFIETARAVYLKNDERYRLKQEINQLVGSTIIEEKSHA
jgi:hypothetical protein